MLHGYVPMTVKALAPEAGRPRRISGIASTPTRDRQGDVIEPLGMTFKNPVPLLAYHDQKLPIGLATLTATPEAITFDAEIVELETPGPLRDAIEQTWELVTKGLIGAASVAIAHARAVVEPLREGGFRIKAGEILELSLCTIGANPDAAFRIKALTDAAAARPRGGSTPMTIPEQIDALEIQVQTTRARMDALLDRSRDENRTLTPEESTEYDALDVHVKRLDGDKGRWKERELVSKAAAVAPGEPPKPTPPPTFTGPITVTSRLPPGSRFTRLAMCKMYGNGNPHRELEYARQFKDTPEVEAIIKAAVPIGTTTDATWAGPLVPTMQTIVSEFLPLLRAATVLPRIPGLKNVPFNVRVPAQTGGGTYGWVGEGLSKPVTKLAFSAITLAQHKIAGLVVFTEELARNSSPSAEETVRNDMIAGIAAFIDSQFLDPAVAAVAGVNPASVTNGLTPITSTNNVIADIREIFTALTAANIDSAGGSLLMSPTNAFALATYMVTGAFAFPGITMDGGSVVGVNVVTSSILGTNVVFIARNCVMVADEGGVQIDVSREASVQMDSAPTSPPTAPLVSLWQQNLVGLRADRFISWVRARQAGVQLVTGADYSTMVSPTVGFALPAA